ncbi:MAG: hypothetical protein JST38_01505 [Bacteroidetes bacterium]|nr:hypothetical protein [Bacteroidota bacterium]
MRAVVLLFALAALGAQAQLPHGGSPVAWGGTAHALVAPPVMELGPVDPAAAMAEADTAGAPGGLRFGVQRAMVADILAQGQWSPMPGGGSVCRFRLKSNGAVMMSVQFSAFHLPPGGRVFLYNAAHSTFLGGFTQANEQPSGRFATAFLPGDEVTVEYQQPAGAGAAVLHVASITHAWRDMLRQGSAAQRDINPGYQSAPCHNNVACPIAADWQDQNHATLWFMMPDGRGCDGTLLNNTLQDGTPYVLIANHCWQPTEDQWIFYFNYQSPTCIGDTGQTAQTLSGCVRRAVLYPGDFCLMEINEPPPPSFGAYYAGWDHSGNPPQSGASILNPQADVKKISFYNTPATSTTIDVAQIPCWQTYWYSGILEAGASGAPLFDQNKRVVGHIIGGEQTCATATTEPSFAAKFSENWDGGTGPASRLRDWLDPANTTTALDGYDPNGALPTVAVKLTAMLAGPFVQSAGLMASGLNDNGMLPLVEPYTAMGYVHHGNGGGESTTADVLAVTGADRVVDWVVVELRNKNNPAVVLATHSALLRRNGTIVDEDGISDVEFQGVPADNYYVAVRHRNHLGIMTAAAVPLTATATLKDFTNGSVALAGGTASTKLVGTTRCLWAGDANFNGSVSYTGVANDRDPVLRINDPAPTAIYSGYAAEDFNMDGMVKYTGAGNDRDLILTTTGNLPTLVVTDSLP